MRSATAGLVLCLTACAGDADTCLEGEALWGSALPHAFCVEGDLVVQGRMPSEFEQLTGLVEVTGSLIIQENPALLELPTLPALRRIGGSLTISRNDALRAVHGFPLLEELSGSLYLGGNPFLATFSFGSAPLTIGGAFIALNPSLAELRLPELIGVDGDIRVMSNSHLQILALPGLTEVGRDFFLADNPWLETVDCSELRSAEGWNLTGNAALRSLAGFPALAEVTNATLSDNDALSTLRWSASVAKTLIVTDNDALERIEGEPSGGSFGAVRIAENLRLRSVVGFSSVLTAGHLGIENNPELFTIDAWEALESVVGLHIVGNEMLVGPEAWLPSLAEISEDFSIYRNPVLPPAVVDVLLERVHVGGVIRVGDNENQSTELDPCPWSADGVCDEMEGLHGAGTGLCAFDPEDCEPVMP